MNSWGRHRLPVLIGHGRLVPELGAFLTARIIILGIFCVGSWWQGDSDSVPILSAGMCWLSDVC